MLCCVWLCFVFIKLIKGIVKLSSIDFVTLEVGEPNCRTFAKKETFEKSCNKLAFLI